MRGRLVDLSMGMNRKQRITIEVDRDFREDFDRLIDGAIEVAKELGIETDTPEQLARYKEEWGRS